MSYSTETFLAHHLRHLRGDVFGGITVAVVALPLSLAFGVASGAGPMAGLYGAILLGFFAAVFGGCPPQISGPTGPMVVVMAALITQLPSNPQAAFTAVLLAGAFQLLFGALRLGSYITYVPFPVVSGFMSGVGCLIIVLQLGPLLGHPGSDQGVFKALAMLPEQLAAPSLGALAVAGAALAVMLFLPARLRRLVPPPLLALLVGTGMSLWLFPEVRVIGPIPHGLPHFSIPPVDPETFPVVLRGGLALALLGAIDSVLTSLIADSLTRSRHDPNREMIGQGIGNAVCGLFGAVAGSGATMRTAVNVRSGGRTRLSGALHAAVLLALVLGMSPLVEHIPMAALAAVLLKVGWDIIDWQFLRLVVKADRQEMLVMFTVLLLTVLVDLLTAVAVGLIMASLVSARNLSAHQAAQLRLVSSEVDEAPFSDVERELIRQGGGQILLLHLSGPFSFCSSKDLVHRLAGIGTPYKTAVLDLSDTVTLDTSVAMAIGQILENLAQDGITAFVSGMEGQVAQDLMRMGVLDQLPAEHRVATRIEALRLAVAAAEGAGQVAANPPAA